MTRAVIVKRGRFLHGHDYSTAFGYSFSWTPDPKLARVFSESDEGGALVTLSLRSGGRIHKLPAGKTLPERLTPEPIKLTTGHACRCKDGVTRWIIMVHKPGGRAVTWDTAPFRKDYFAEGPFRERGIREAAGQAGHMGYVKFQRLALEDITEAATAAATVASKA